MAPYYFSTILVVDIKMKTAILVFFISLTIFAIGESCLVVNCSGVTAATCTSPCYNCGACRQNCCRKYRIFMINCRGYYLKTFSECEATIRMRQLLE